MLFRSGGCRIRRGLQVTFGGGGTFRAAFGGGVGKGVGMEGACGSIGDCWKGLGIGSTSKHLWNWEAVGVQRMPKVSGDDLFSAPKASQSFSNSDLRHLQHSLDSNHLPVPKTFQSTSYSKPLPAFHNATVCSFHSNTSPDTPSEGCSGTSASSKGNPETSSDSAPSNPNSALMFFGDSLSHSGDRVTPAASDIKGQVIKVVCNMKG